LTALASLAALVAASSLATLTTLVSTGALAALAALSSLVAASTLATLATLTALVAAWTLSALTALITTWTVSALALVSAAGALTTGTCLVSATGRSRTAFTLLTTRPLLLARVLSLDARPEAFAALGTRMGSLSLLRAWLPWRWRTTCVCWSARRLHGGRRRCNSWSEVCRTLGDRQAEAAQAFIFLPTPRFLFLFLLCSLVTGFALVSTSLPVCRFGIVFSLATQLFVSFYFCFAFAAALFVFPTAFLFLADALVFLLLALFHRLGLLLALVFLNQRHHLADIFILNICAGARLDGNAVLLRNCDNFFTFELCCLG
jgi:hypothetical protein